MSERKLLRLEEAADRLGVTRSWLLDHTSRVEPIVPHRRLGRLIRFAPEDLEEFVAGRREERPVWRRVA